MKNNLKEIKTTILGSILIILGVLYFALPHFSERELWEVNNLYLGMTFGGGVLLLLAPDRVLDIAFGWLKKKSE